MINKLPLFIFLCLTVFLLIGRAAAQERRHMRILHYADKDTSTVKKDSVPQKDLFDEIRKLNHKKKLVVPKSDTTIITKKDTITSRPVKSFIPAVGYTLTSGLAFTLSGNIAFRLAPNTRISTITASAAFTLKKQFTLPIESNIWSKNGEYLFVGDYRFYKYPQSTFGLGSNSNINNEDPMNYIYARFYETVLRHIAGNLYLGAGYIIDYHGNIAEQGNTNGTPSDYKAYNLPATNHSTSSGITVNGLFDSRDNSINASRGYYAAFQYRDSYRDLGSTSGWRSLILDLRHYIRFPEGSNNVLALWSYDWLVLSGKPPYLDLPATSWDPYSSTGRGYIQGRFRGAQMVYGEAEYRYRISANGLFGGVIFANAESFSAAPGTCLQSIQPGIGPGIRIKLNKVSKTNVCIDYGFGREGSRGLFVNVGELF